MFITNTLQLQERGKLPNGIVYEVAESEMNWTWTTEDGKRALETMRLRASCRDFEDKAIPPEVLEDIIQTGLAAASGGNLQPVSIIVIKKEVDNNKIYELCGNQRFMAQAPVNLLFLLDWHKMGIYAQKRKAPFTCTDSYMHFLIALEDVMCTAQTIETAAHLMGVGSCYVGTTNHCGDDIIKAYNLPPHTYPVILLSLGYPKSPLKINPKLHSEIMVFQDRYPDLTEEFIVEKYNEKYGNAAFKFPKNEPYKTDTLERFRLALLTTYSEEETSEIIEKAKADGLINETQRRFGLHYHAEEMRILGEEVVEMMEKQGFTPFHKQ